MLGDFIAWIKHKNSNRVRVREVADGLKEWFKFFRYQNITCRHDYKLIKADLYFGSTYICRNCYRRRVSKRELDS